MVEGYRPQMRTVSKPLGGAWGGGKVNDKFLELIYELIGPARTTILRQSFEEMDLVQNIWSSAMKTAQRKQSDSDLVVVSVCALLLRLISFGRAPDTNSVRTVQLSDVSTLLKITESELKEMVEVYNGQPVHVDRLDIHRWNLKMTRRHVHAILNSQIDPIVAYVESLLSGEFRDVRYVMLVGGFGESKLLQTRFRQMFQTEGRQVLIAAEPGSRCAGRCRGTRKG
jgi:hypothetical protein